MVHKKEGKANHAKKLDFGWGSRALAVNSGVCGDRHGEFVAIMRYESSTRTTMKDKRSTKGLDACIESVINFSNNPMGTLRFGVFQ